VKATCWPPCSPPTPNGGRPYGIDTRDDLAKVPAGFAGYLWTNRIELIGPAATTPK